MSFRIAAAALTALIVLPTLPAVAQGAAPAVSREQALDIAKRERLVTLEEIELDDSRWEIEGDQANGREIELDVDSRTGAIVKLEKD